MQSKAKTVEEYLKELPEERREAIEAVRSVILANIPDGYEEAMNWGMITYQVPLSTFSGTYNKQPLMYLALASQKNNLALYMTGLSMNPQLSRDFEADYAASGKRRDIGKSCVRFKKLTDLPLDVVARYISKVTVDMLVDYHQRVHAES